MDKTKTVKTRKTPTPAFAVISFLVIVAVLVALINLGVDTTMSVFIAALIAVVIALLLDIPWADVERTLLRVVSDCIPTFLIVIMVGMLVGIWMAGGTVPALMYYGMKLISPKILVPLAFVLSGLTAEFTGTSFGSVATMALPWWAWPPLLPSRYRWSLLRWSAVPGSATRCPLCPTPRTWPPVSAGFPCMTTSGP